MDRNKDGQSARPGDEAGGPMRICDAGGFQKVVVILVFGALLFPVTLYGLYMGLLAPSLPGAQRLVFLAGGILFGALTAWGVYRAVWLGTGWVEYDQETVILHWNRRSYLRLRWAEIPGRRVQAELWESGYLFTYLPAGEKCRLGVTRLSKGFKELERTMEAAGVLRRMGVVTLSDIRPVAESFFSQFERDQTNASGRKGDS